MNAKAAWVKHYALQNSLNRFKEIPWDPQLKRIRMTHVRQSNGYRIELTPDPILRQKTYTQDGAITGHKPEVVEIAYYKRTGNACKLAKADQIMHPTLHTKVHFREGESAEDVFRTLLRPDLPEEAVVAENAIGSIYMTVHCLKNESYCPPQWSTLHMAPIEPILFKMHWHCQEPGPIWKSVKSPTGFSITTKKERTFEIYTCAQEEPLRYTIKPGITSFNIFGDMQGKCSDGNRFFEYTDMFQHSGIPEDLANISITTGTTAKEKWLIEQSHTLGKRILKYQLDNAEKEPPSRSNLPDINIRDYDTLNEETTAGTSGILKWAQGMSGTLHHIKNHFGSYFHPHYCDNCNHRSNCAVKIVSSGKAHQASNKDIC